MGPKNSANEIRLARIFDAPVKAVWEAWTDSEQVAQWWGPRGFTITTHSKDFRAGGHWSYTMHGPDGEVHQHNGTYLAFDEGRRFASTDAISGDLEPATPFMIGIWEIAPEGTGTSYTARARHWSEEEAQKHLEMGFNEGWGACADQLVALCEAC